MAINIKGNTGRVESTKLKSLIITNELRIFSLNKCFTRHWSNMALCLPINQYALLSFLVYMSDAASSFKYTTHLLKQYEKCSELAISHYKQSKVTYTTSIPMVRESFIKLIEQGLIIKMTKKSYYMINPFLVYNGNVRLFSGKKIMRDYLEILKSADVSAGLTKYCDSIDEKIQKELKRTNINKRINESKGNSSQG